MIRICCLVVISLVAAEAGGGCIVVVSANMAIAAINGSVGTLQDIIVTMDRESCRLPVRISSMTGTARGRNAQCAVIGIGRLVVISLVAAQASVGGVGVIPAHMTIAAVYGGM